MVDPAIKWLLSEGILPLLGAGVLYLIWGCCRFVVTTDRTQFNYHWWQAIDTLGWLYGAVILSIQAGLKGFGVARTGVLPLFCFIAAAICLLLLISAMTERGANPKWEPPLKLKFAAGILAIGILIAGFRVQSIVLIGGNP